MRPLRSGRMRQQSRVRRRGFEAPIIPAPARIKRPKNNVVYTDPKFARRIVEYFRPSGFCLDPCKGLGAFYDALPSPKDWCEIEQGRDFLNYQPIHNVAWIITNLPWSADEYRPLARRCFELADNVVLLVRLHNGLGTTARHNDYTEFGHRIKEIIICPWDAAGFPVEGFALAIIHWQKRWQGDCKWTYWHEEPAPPTAKDLISLSPTTVLREPPQLFCGDCLTILPALPDKSIDLVLTDLPTGVTACEWDVVIPLDKLWHEYRRVAKETTVFVFTATQPFTTQLINSCMEWFRYELIWEKPQGTNPLLAKNMPLKSHENILVFYNKRGTYNPQMEEGAPYSGFTTKNGATIGEIYGNAKSIHAANPGVRYPKSVLRFKQERGGLHPTQKPTALMEYLIRTYSNQGDTVLDNCMGSGTTGVAALNMKRKFIGIERDPEFFSIAKDRLGSFARSA